MSGEHQDVGGGAWSLARCGVGGPHGGAGGDAELQKQDEEVLEHGSKRQSRGHRLQGTKNDHIPV